MKRFFYLCTILCTLFALMPIVALAQERGLATDSMKAKQFVKTLGKDARVLLFLPTSSPKNVFYTVKKSLKYYNVDTRKNCDIKFIDYESDGKQYHDTLIIGETRDKGTSYCPYYYKTLVFSGDSNIVIVEQTTATVKNECITYRTTDVYKLSPHNMHFTELGSPAEFETDEKDYLFSKINVSYKNKTISIKWCTDGYINNSIYTMSDPLSYVLGKSFTKVFDFDGNLLSKTSKDYTLREHQALLREYEADFKKYYNTQPQMKTAPQRRKTTSKRSVRR